MKIEPPADDFGLQNLKRTDRTATTVRQVDHLGRTPAIAPSEERRESAPAVPDRERRSGQDRRSGEDRRRNSEPHLLNTRAPHERRTRSRRTEDRAQEEEEQRQETRPGGIDVRV